MSSENQPDVQAQIAAYITGKEGLDEALANYRMACAAPVVTELAKACMAAAGFHAAEVHAQGGVDLETQRRVAEREAAHITSLLTDQGNFPADAVQEFLAAEKTNAENAARTAFAEAVRPPALGRHTAALMEHVFLKKSRL